MRKILAPLNSVADSYWFKWVQKAPQWWSADFFWDEQHRSFKQCFSLCEFILVAANRPFSSFGPVIPVATFNPIDCSQQTPFCSPVHGTIHAPQQKPRSRALPFLPAAGDPHCPWGPQTPRPVLTEWIRAVGLKRVINFDVCQTSWHTSDIANKTSNPSSSSCWLWQYRCTSGGRTQSSFPSHKPFRLDHTSFLFLDGINVFV